MVSLFGKIKHSGVRLPERIRVVVLILSEEDNWHIWQLSSDWPLIPGSEVLVAI
jgi:hypothetical protein